MKFLKRKKKIIHLMKFYYHKYSKNRKNCNSDNINTIKETKRIINKAEEKKDLNKAFKKKSYLNKIIDVKKDEVSNNFLYYFSNLYILSKL